jgi:hypothetical protein
LTLLALAPVLLATAAFAGGEQTLTYDLVLGGRKVGTRELVVRHFPPEDDLGPSRMITSWTDLSAQVGGQTVTFQGRATIRATDARLSYSSIFDQNGERVSVQGRQTPDGGWTLTRADRSGTQELTYRRTEAEISTFHLLDPTLRNAASESGRATVLVAETGTVAAGPAQVDPNAEVTIAGRVVPVTRWAWDPPAGRMEVAWSPDGVPVQYTLQFLGQTLTATLDAVPESDWGGVQVQTFQATSGGTVLEEDL